MSLLIKSILATSLLMILLKPFAYALCGVVLALNELIIKTNQLKIWNVLKFPIYLILYTPFYVLGALMIVISYILGYDVLSDDETSTDSL